jgi:hypothetical protein
MLLNLDKPDAHREVFFSLLTFGSIGLLDC